MRSTTSAVLLVFLLTSCEIPVPDYQARWQDTAKITDNPATAPATTLRPALVINKTPGYSYGQLINPFLAPIQITFEKPLLLDGSTQVVVGAKHSKRFKLAEPVGEQFTFAWVLGDSTITPDPHDYLIPFKGKKRPISQAFGGKFSHNDDENQFAIDIALPISTTIVAARSGLVIEVVDQFEHGGLNPQLRSQANYLTILHDDGTFSEYSHLAANASLVAVGQYVKAGDEIALSGATGYAKAPHLHFMVWRNIEGKRQSIAFTFNINGQSTKPTLHMWLNPKSTQLAAE